MVQACIDRDLSMAGILPFAFEVGCEGYLGQVWMHVCVHLYTRVCTRSHPGTGTGAGFETSMLRLIAFRSHQSAFGVGFNLAKDWLQPLHFADCTEDNCLCALQIPGVRIKCIVVWSTVRGFKRLCKWLLVALLNQ